MHSSYFYQLPEEVIRLIFGHLQDYELFLNVRPVCLHLKRIVDSDIRLGIVIINMLHTNAMMKC